MIARWIDLCARNRFLVFTGTLLLVLTGVWAERRMPLDALPDISDVRASRKGGRCQTSSPSAA